jgi:transposase
MPPIPAVPPEIARPVRAVFGSNNFYLRVGDQLEALLAELRTASLMAVERPLLPDVPVLALVTCFQYAEGLSDVQAADALRTRLEWRYALHLPVVTPVIAETAFCRYRQDLLVDPVALREMGALAQRLNQLGFAQPLVRVASELLPSICALNRLLWLYQAMERAVELLASRQPEWLGAIARPYWYTLYRAVESRAGNWANKTAAEAMSLTIGADICYLLETMASAGDIELAQRRELLALAKQWEEQFMVDAAGEIRLRPYCDFCSAGSQTQARWN